MASSATFHVAGARSPHCCAEPGGEPLGADVRATRRAELADGPAEHLAVDTAGALLLGPAQGGEVGVDGAAEGDVAGGRGDAADCSHEPMLSEKMAHFL